MFINPNTAIEEGWITGINDPETQIQPNAVDFTIDHLYSIDQTVPFIISNDSKHMRGGTPVDLCDGMESLEIPPKIVYGGKWELRANSVYDGMSNITVDLPEGVACNLIIRSTFNRNGLFLTSGLYDSGYNGPIGFAIHNRSGYAYIEPGTRIGQITFMSSDSAGMYAGGYNHEAGTHWSGNGGSNNSHG